MPARLSKSKFTVGLQCHRRLWWQVHEPDAPELVVDAATQATFERGTRVGELAREHVPGGVLIDVPHDRIARRLEATERALSEGAPVVYEASFEADRVFVAVDVLSRGRRGVTITEVKSSTKVKPEHLPDAAIQAHVLRRRGLDVRKVEVMHLNRDCRAPDLSNLFTRADVTAEVEAHLPSVPGEVKRQLRMLDGPLPDVEPGDFCHTPYVCPFVGRCWGELPEHHVSTLHAIRRDKLDALLAAGYETLDELGPDVPLSSLHDRQRRAVQAGELVVERGLRAALDSLEPPLAYLDFEAVNPAVPVWDGCRPYDHVPVQFSIHLEDARGRVRHVAWLAEGPGDPRPELADALLRACARARTVVAYHAAFERARLRELGEALPRRRGALRDLEERLVDLLPLVRNHVYHPAFGGSFSMKSVAPALVPDVSYDGLSIADGATASTCLEQLLLRGDELSATEVRRLRKDLLRYCELDTLAMVGLVARLRELAG